MQRAKSIFAQWRISNLIAWGWDSTGFCCLFAFSLSLFINKSGWVQIRERNWVKQCSYRLFLLCAKFAQHAFCPIYISGRKKWMILWGCSGGFSASAKGKSQVAKPTNPLPTENSKQPLQQWQLQKVFIHNHTLFLVSRHAHKGQSWFGSVAAEIVET